MIDKISNNKLVEPITDGLIEQQAIVPLSDVGRRLDQVAAELFSDFSRSRLKLWINQGELLVDDQQQVPKYKLLGGENLVLSAELEPEGDWQPENIPLDIVFEDDHIIVINKPANFVVHPAAGNYSGTLLNALLHHCPALLSVPRAGIVHRLDKDTTGLMVVAKTLQAHTDLVMQLQARKCVVNMRQLSLALSLRVARLINRLGVMPSSAPRWRSLAMGKKQEHTIKFLSALMGIAICVSS